LAIFNFSKKSVYLEKIFIHTIQKQKIAVSIFSYEQGDFFPKNNELLYKLYAYTTAFLF